MTREFSGALSERVVIERRAAGNDGAGGLSDEWEPVVRRWARVAPAGRAETSRLTADTRLTARNWEIVLRPVAGVTLDMRVRWRSLTLRLVGVIADPASPDRMTLLAEELGP